MTTVRNIARNVAFMTIAQILSYGLGFFYIIYTARYLGAESFGVLSFALALTAIFAVLTDMGLQPLTIREVARNKKLASKYLANITSIKFILSIITFVLIVLIIKIMNAPAKTTAVVYIVTLSVLITSFTAMIYSIFQAHERMEFQAIGLVICSVVMFAGAIISIQAGLDVTVFASLYLVASIISLCYSLLVLATIFRNVFIEWARLKIFQINITFCKTTIKEALPFGMGLFFVMVFYWIDSVMLSYYKGDAVVGWYNAAYRMVIVLLFIPQTLIQALYPVMANSQKENTVSLKGSHEKSFRYLSILAVPIAVGTTLLAPRFILLIFGTEYENSILPLQVLVWSAVFIYMSITYGNLFNCLNKQGLVTKIAGTCVVLNIILNVILIPKYSLLGASIATVLTEFIALTLCIIVSLNIESTISTKNIATTLSKTIISAILMGVFIVIFRGLHLLILTPLSAAFYFIVLFISKGINKDDLSLLRVALTGR